MGRPHRGTERDGTTSARRTGARRRPFRSPRNAMCATLSPARAFVYWVVFLTGLFLAVGIGAIPREAPAVDDAAYLALSRALTRHRLDTESARRAPTRRVARHCGHRPMSGR